MPRWWWVCDATPGSRVAALPAPDEVEAHAEPPPLPGSDETVSFSKHVRPLFRRVDRQSMMFAFDLWAYEDVVRHAGEIPRRLESGTMPCDGAWPKQQVEIFQRWVEVGTPAQRVRGMLLQMSTSSGGAGPRRGDARRTAR
jgi:hypothetical protein